MAIVPQARRLRIHRLSKARRRALQLESLESRVLLSATVSSADLHDTWSTAGMAVTGSIVFDGAGHIVDGSLTDTTGQSSAAGGTYSLSSSGSFTAVINSLNVRGGINSARDLVVYTQT